MKLLIEKSDTKSKMTFTDRINVIKSAFSGLTNQSGLSMTQRFTPTYGEPPRRSTSEWMEMYNKSPRMNPIHQIASDVATSVYGLYDKKDIKRTNKLKDNSIELLLRNPNTDKTITEYALLYVTQVYLMLPSGEAFWIKERNGLGKITQLWPVPPGWVNEIPSSSKPFFTIYAQGNMQSAPVYVLPEDMVYFKKPDITNPYLRGRGRAEGIADEIEIDEYQSKYQKRFFFNDAIPSMVIPMPGANELTINRAEEKWNQKFGGYNNKHKTAFVNWEMKAQILKETNKDMDFIESRRYLRDVSNQHFSIPPELMGILENSNRSTIDAAYYIYTKNVLRKELKFIDDTLNIQLVSEFGNSIFLEHDNVVPEDDEFELKKATEGLKNGGITVDEWRQANGWELLPNGKGKILYTPLNMIPTPLDGSAVTTNLEPVQREPIETQPPEKPKKKALTPEIKNQMWNVFDKAAIKYERSFESAAKKFFQGQQERVNKSIEKSVKAYDEPLDWEEENNLLKASLSPSWMASLTEGFEMANATYSLRLSFDLFNPKFKKYIEKYGLDKAKNINNTTKDKLRKSLSEGIGTGEGIPKLRDRISTIYTEAKTSRATLIARTETVSTVNTGAFETYKGAKLEQKEWLATSDTRTRETHASINREVVDINKPFSNGLMYPGDSSGSASEVCNCRCTILPVIPD